MKKEKSCGAVIFKKLDGKVYYLIEKMGLGHNSMCKGHVEDNETEHETALREIKEETNLDVNFIDGFKETIEYEPYNDSNVLKTVIFFLATPTDDRTPCDLHDDEVTSISFMPYEEAYEALTHASDKDVLKSAQEFILKKNL